MIDYQEVGNRIRYYRRKKSVTQEELAFEIQTSAAYVSNIERAIKKPSLAKLVQIAEALGISLEDIISSPPSLEKEAEQELERIFYLCSKSDKRRIVNNLFEIINILERSG